MGVVGGGVISVNNGGLFVLVNDMTDGILDFF